MRMRMRTLAVVGVLVALVAPATAVTAGTFSVAPGFYQAQTEGGGTQELSKSKRYYLHGVELMNNLKYLDAVEQFQLAIDEDPNYVDAYRRLALAYTEMAKSDPEYYQDALDVYEDLEGLLPEDDVEVRKNKAYVQAAMGDIDDAIATYHEILTITPKDCGIWSQIGRAQKGMAERLKADKGADDPGYEERLKKAIAAYRKVTEYCPEDVDAYNILGEIYYGMGKTKEASEVYEKLLEKDPKNEDVASRLAYLYYKAKDWKKAAPAYKRLLDLNPDRLNDRALYAQVLQKLGQTDAAAEQYKSIIAADPSKNSLYCNLGFLYLEAKDWKKAIETAMKGIGENAPVQGCMYVIWGQGLEYKGDSLLKQYEFDQAISTYEDAKLKLKNAYTDSNFGDYARKRTARINQLIERAKQVKAKAEQGGK